MDNIYHTHVISCVDRFERGEDINNCVCNFLEYKVEEDSINKEYIEHLLEVYNCN